MGTHITKVKSVNLDGWKPDLVEMYKHMNNMIVNAFWEANLPRNYQKPGQNASSHEVESFIRDKYVNKRWAASGADPATLYWTDRKKFDKFVKKLTEGGDDGEPEEEQETQKKKKDKKKSKKHQEDDEEKPSAPPKLLMGKQADQLGDLISFDSVPASKPSAGAAIDGFTDFVDADPLKSTDNDFSDFQECKKAQAPP